MDAVIVDARGFSCPQPVLMTKNTLEKAKSGKVEVLVDTVTSRENVMRFGGHAGWKTSFEETKDGFRVLLEK